MNTYLAKYLAGLQHDKVQYLTDMLGQFDNRQVPYRTVLLDNWYATTALFK
ncbi:MAG: hypothetical protein ACRYF0_10125 [Janthinobacterium lividum]